MMKNKELLFAKTTLHMEQCTFLWSIENFNEFSWIKKPKLESPEFSTSTSGNKWKLLLHFFGDTPDLDDYFSITLKSFSSEELETKFKIAFVQSDGGLHSEKSANFIFKGDEFIFYKFINKEELFTNQKILLPQNVLTIRCEMKYLKEIKNSSTRYQPFNISWNGYYDSQNYKNDTIQKNYKVLRKVMPTNVTLLVNNMEIKAHKCVLSTASLVFAKMFEHDMLENLKNIVRIDNFNFDTINSLVEFIYNGTIKEELTLDSARDLYAAASLYQIEDLVKLCSDHIKKNLNEDTVCEFLHLADIHNDEDLKIIAKRYLCDRAPTIFGTAEWKQVSQINPSVSLGVLQSYVDNRLPLNKCQEGQKRAADKTN